MRALQTYELSIVAMDSGQTRRSSTATVTINIVDDSSQLPPQWQMVRNQYIDDLINVNVDEDVGVNTAISNNSSLRLEARAAQGQVQYHLTNNGPAELNGNEAFKMPTPNSLGDSSLMPIVTSRNLDASIVPDYVLRCRAFVSVCFFSLFCVILKVRVCCYLW